MNDALNTSVVKQFEAPDSDHFGVDDADAKDEREPDEEANDDESVGEVKAVVVARSRGGRLALVVRSGREIFENETLLFCKAAAIASILLPWVRVPSTPSTLL